MEAFLEVWGWQQPFLFYWEGRDADIWIIRMETPAAFHF